MPVDVFVGPLFQIPRLFLCSLAGAAVRVRGQALRIKNPQVGELMSRLAAVYLWARSPAVSHQRPIGPLLLHASQTLYSSCSSPLLANESHLHSHGHHDSSMDTCARMHTRMNMHTRTRAQRSPTHTQAYALGPIPTRTQTWGPACRYCPCTAHRTHAHAHAYVTSTHAPSHTHTLAHTHSTPKSAHAWQGSGGPLCHLAGRR